MAAMAQNLLVRSIWSSFLKMSNLRAAIHTRVTLASTHEDPLVGILFAVIHVSLFWVAGSCNLAHSISLDTDSERNRS